VPSLSRSEIVDAAIAVADAEGPDAVSMRRIAQELTSGTMSLYWHVANKEHLLDLMLDALVTEVGVPEPSGDWRADLQTVARENRAMLLRHRWVMDFTHVVRFLDEDIGPDAEETRDKRFEFGLDCVLDGIAVKIAEVSRHP
jgi:AcrR family transcriptional regulator